MNKGTVYLKKNDPILKVVIERARLNELSQRRDYFEALVQVIVGQQLSIKAANTIFNRFVALTPGKKFPTPLEILAMPPQKIRKAGLSNMKISFLKDLSNRVLDKTVDLKKIDAWDNEQIIEHLTAVKGIGRWTAEMFLIFSLGRADVFSYGDLGLRNAIRNVYGLKAHPTERQAEKLSSCWKPYRSLASRYLWASLNNESQKTPHKKKT